MLAQGENPVSISRPKFVWFLVIYFGFSVSYRILVYFIFHAGIIILDQEQFSFLKSLSLFEYAVSLVIALLNLGGSLALFNLKPIAPRILLWGCILSIAEGIWTFVTKPGLDSVKSGFGLLMLTINIGFLTYVVYYAYLMRKQGLLGPRTATLSPASPPTQPPAQSPPQLPIAPDWLLNNIAEASKIASRIYTIFLGLLAYCALTVVSTTDRQILFDEPARLPLVNLGVPLVGFFILSPLLALLVFVYLQLYLHRIKGLIAQLRTQYAPIEDRQLYPWMLTIAEEPEPGDIGRLQKGIVTLSLWWSLPIVLFLFPIWFTKKHDPALSYVVGFIPLIGLWLVVWFWHTYEPGRRRGRVALATLGSVVSALILIGIIPLSNAGRLINGITNINLNHEVLVTKPDQDYEALYWADLHGAHLEGAQLNYSVLSRANVEGAFFRFANLIFARLDKANLSHAHLVGAYLGEAHLEEAILNCANLEATDLRDAHLDRAELSHAHLRGVKNLTITQIAKAKTLFMAQLDPLLLKTIKKDYPRLWEPQKSAQAKSDSDCLHDPPPNLCDVCSQ